MTFLSASSRGDAGDTGEAVVNVFVTWIRWTGQYHPGRADSHGIRNQCTNLHRCIRSVLRTWYWFEAGCFFMSAFGPFAYCDLPGSMKLFCGIRQVPWLWSRPNHATGVTNQSPGSLAEGPCASQLLGAGLEKKTVACDASLHRGRGLRRVGFFDMADPGKWCLAQQDGWPEPRTRARLSET